MSYSFTSQKPMTLNVDGQQVKLKPNEPYTTDDPCKLAELISGWQNKMKALGEDPSFSESEEGLYRDAVLDCSKRLFGDMFAALAPDTPDENKNAGLTLGDGKPPPDGDTPAGIGAPSPDPKGGVAKSLNAGGSSEKPPGAQHTDPKDPKSLQQIAEDAQNQGQTPDQAAQTAESARRNEPRKGERHIDFSDGRRDTPAESVDPVQIFSGEFAIDVVDIEIASPGFPLLLRRLYRSGRVYFGPWGFQWDHNYNVYLRELADGNVSVWTGRLREDHYTLQPDGSFEPPVAVFAKLSRVVVAPNERWVLSDNQCHDLEFARPAGWPEPDRIPLISITDRNGNKHSLTYDAQGRLSQVKDAFGRYLDFTYGGCNLLEEVSDHTGRVWRYVHDDGIEHLVAAISPPTDEFPDGRASRYAYDRYNGHPALQHGMITVVDGDGRITVENKYGQDPVSDDFGRVVWQDLTGGVCAFAAERLQFVPRTPEAINIPALRVSVLDPGFLYVYTFNHRGDLIDRRHRLIVDGSYRLVADTYRYDEFGNQVSHYDSDGAGMVYEYDTANADPRARGHLLLAKRVASPLKPALALEVFRATYEPQFFQLKSYRDAAGGITTLIYDHELGPGGVGDLKEMRRPPFTQPDGTVVTPIERFSYNARGQLLAHEQDDEEHRYEYSEIGFRTGLLLAATHERNGLTVSERYERDDVGNLVAKIDGEGNRTEYVVDAFNLIRSTRHADGVQWQFSYDGVGRLRSAFEPRGDYDDPILAGAPIRHDFTYEPSGFLVQEVFGANTSDPRKFTYTRSAEGRVLTQSDPGGRHVKRVLDERGLMLRETISDASGIALHERKFVYSRTGSLRKISVPGGASASFEQDGFGRLTKAIDPDGTIFDLDLNASDQVTRVRITGRTKGVGSPVGLLAQQAIEYNEQGVMVRREDSVFDHIGGPAATYTSTFASGPDGRLAQSKDHNGLGTTYTYGPLGLILECFDTEGNGEQREYDGSGRTISRTRHETGADGLHTYRFELAYDPVGRVKAETGPLGESAKYQYDARGQMVSATSASGTLVALRRNAFGDVIEQQLGANVMQWTRDAVGRPVELKDPSGSVTRFEYDVLSRLREVVAPDGRSQAYEYRADGVLARFQDFDGSTISYDSTAAGLPSRVSAAGPGVPVADHVLEYDGLRRLVSASFAGLNYSRSFDSLGRLRREEAAGSPLEIDYTNGGKDWQVSYPNGRAELHKHDPLGRLNSISLLSAGAGPALGVALGADIAEYEWDGPARPLRAQFANGTSFEASYDSAGRLAEFARERPGATIYRERLYRDALGLVQATQTDSQPPSRAALTLDEMQRIVELRRDFPPAALPSDPANLSQAQLDAAAAAARAAPPANSTKFTWTSADTPKKREELDGAGNVTAAVVFSTNALNQIDAVDGSAVKYDGRGDVVEINGRQLAYDSFRRLVEVSDAGGTILRLRYDPFGRIASLDEQGTVTEFRYLGDELVEASIGGVTVQQRSPGIALDQPAAVHLAAGTHFPIFDGSGSIVALTEMTGNVAERYGYDVFGAPEIRSPNGANLLAQSAVGFAPHYHGRPYLASAGLYDFRNRVYSPTLLGFLQPDPITFSGSWSHYGFARYNPYSFTDSSGAWVHLLIGAAIGAAIGGIGAWLSGGDFWDILVGIGAGAVGGALCAAGMPMLAGAAAGGIMGAWSGGRIGYKMGGTKGAVIGALGGGVIGAGVGALSGGIGGRVGNAVSTRVYGTVFNTAVNRGITATTSTTIARTTSMVAGGYAGGATGGIVGNTTSTIAVDLATGKPIEISQLGDAVYDGVTRDGALGAVGASAERYALVARIPGMTGNAWDTIPGRANVGLEGEILVGKAIGADVARNSETINVNGRNRHPDFPLAQTVATDANGVPAQNIVEVKNKNSLSSRDTAQIRDFATAAANPALNSPGTSLGGGNVILYHRPGMSTAPVSGINNITFLPIPQQPFVVPLPYGFIPQKRAGEGSK